MRVIVSYDVATTDSAGRSRLRRVAKACKSYGIRVQYSIFECSVTDRELVKLKSSLLALIKPDDDSLRFYFVSEDDAHKTEHYGVRRPIDPDGPLIV
jgi:CRISPR-associated protein Cas2